MDKSKKLDLGDVLHLSYATRMVVGFTQGGVLTADLDDVTEVSEHSLKHSSFEVQTIEDYLKKDQHGHTD